MATSYVLPRGPLILASSLENPLAHFVSSLRSKWLRRERDRVVPVGGTVATELWRERRGHAQRSQRTGHMLLSGATLKCLLVLHIEMIDPLQDLFTAGRDRAILLWGPGVMAECSHSDDTRTPAAPLPDVDSWD